MVKRRELMSIGVILFLVTLPFWTSLTSTFGYFDDYSLKGRLASNDFSLTENEFFQDGRPLFGVAIAVIFGDEANIGQLRLARGIGVIGIGMLALMIYGLIRRHGFSERTAMGSAVIFALHPACAIAGFWATAVPLLWSTVLGVASGLCYLAGSRKRWYWYLFSLVFAVISILTYQTGITIAAGIVLVPLFCSEAETFRRDTRTAIVGIFGLCLLLLVYFCLFRFLVSIDFMGNGRSGRGDIIASLPKTLPRLFSLFIPAACGSWSHFLPTEIRHYILGGIGLSMVAGWVFYFREHGKAGFFTFFLWLGTLVILSVPLLPFASMWAHYRVLPALTFALWLPLLSLMQEAGEVRRLGTNMAVLFLGILTTALAVFAISFVRVPQLVQEWSLLGSELEQKVPDFQPHLTVVVPVPYFPQVGFWNSIGEYGIRSTKHAWVLKEMIALEWAQKANCKHLNKEVKSMLRLDLISGEALLSERYLSPPVLNITETPLPDGIKREPPTEFSGVFKGVGPTAEIHPNLNYSDELGLIFRSSDVWVHLEDWGWVYLLKSPADEFRGWSALWGKMSWDKNRGEMKVEDPTKVGGDWGEPEIICNGS